MSQLHHIYRNGRRFDSMDPDTHAVKQFCFSYASDDEGAQYEARDENGEVYYSAQVTRSKTDESI